MYLTPLEWILIITTLLEFNPLFQTFKSIKNKSVKDISPWTFVSIAVIGSLWLYEGFLISNTPLIVGNTFKLFSSLTVIVVYFYFKKKQ